MATRKWNVNDRVTASAKAVLGAETARAWFGETWKTAKACGVVVGHEKSKTKVEWRHESHALTTLVGARSFSQAPEPGSAVASAGAAAAAQSDEASTSGGAPPLPATAPPPGAQTDQTGTGAAASAPSTASALPRGVGIRVLHPTSAGSSSAAPTPASSSSQGQEDVEPEEDAPDDSSLEESAGEEEDEDEPAAPVPGQGAGDDSVVVHGVTWRVGSQLLDPYVDTLRPSVRFSLDPPHGRVDTAAAGSRDEFESTWNIIGHEVMDFVLKNWNEHGKRQYGPRDFMLFIAICLIISQLAIPAGGKRAFWSQYDANGDPFGVLAWPNLGRFLPLHDFEFMLTRAMGKRNPADVYAPVKELVNILNVVSRHCARVGEIITLDESMCPHEAAESKLESIKSGAARPRSGPPKFKIVGKPKGIGHWFFTVASLISATSPSFMVHLEMRHAPEPNVSIPGGASLGKITNAVLRSVLPFRGERRTVVADSLYASVETALACFSLGFYFIGIVKNSSKRFPLEALRTKGANLQRGQWISMTASVQVTMMDGSLQLCNLLAVAWMDKKLFTFIATRGTTAPGRPIVRTRWSTTNRAKIELTIQRPHVVQLFHDHLGLVDSHNRIRQDGFAFESKLRTSSFELRVWSFLMGVALTNAYSLWYWDAQRRADVDFSRSSFTQNLINQILTVASNEKPFSSLSPRSRAPSPVFGSGAGSSSSSFSTPQIPPKRARHSASLADGTSTLDQEDPDGLPVYVLHLSTLDRYKDATSPRMTCSVPECTNRTVYFCAKCTDTTKAIAKHSREVFAICRGCALKHAHAD